MHTEHKTFCGVREASTQISKDRLGFHAVCSWENSVRNWKWIWCSVETLECWKIQECELSEKSCKEWAKPAQKTGYDDCNYHWQCWIVRDTQDYWSSRLALCFLITGLRSTGISFCCPTQNLSIIWLCHLLLILNTNLAKSPQQYLCHSLNIGLPQDFFCHINESKAFNISLPQRIKYWVKCRISRQTVTCIVQS